SLLQTMADCLPRAEGDEVLLWLRSDAADPCATGVRQLWVLYRRAFPRLHFEVRGSPLPTTRPCPQAWLVLRGVHAAPLAALEAGTHLFCPAHAPIDPVHVLALPLPAGMEPERAIEDWQTQRKQWLAALEGGHATVADDPGRYGRVVRIYAERRIVDLR